MDPSVFAAGVVANAMKAKSDTWYWRGGNARLVWFVTTFFGHTFLVRDLLSITGDANVLMHGIGLHVLQG